MGQKTNAVGLRLGINRKWKSSWFCESKNYSKFLHKNLNLIKFFKSFLLLKSIKALLIDFKIIKTSYNNLFIFIFFYNYKKRKNFKRNKFIPLLNLNRIKKNNIVKLKKYKRISFIKKKKYIKKNFYKFNNFNKNSFFSLYKLKNKIYFQLKLILNNISKNNLNRIKHLILNYYYTLLKTNNKKNSYFDKKNFLLLKKYKFRFIKKIKKNISKKLLNNKTKEYLFKNYKKGKKKSLKLFSLFKFSSNIEYYNISFIKNYYNFYYNNIKNGHKYKLINQIFYFKSSLLLKWRKNLYIKYNNIIKNKDLIKKVLSKFYNFNINKIKLLILNFIFRFFIKNNNLKLNFKNKKFSEIVLKKIVNKLEFYLEYNKKFINFDTFIHSYLFLMKKWYVYILSIINKFKSIKFLNKNIYEINLNNKLNINKNHIVKLKKFSYFDFYKKIFMWKKIKKFNKIINIKNKLYSRNLIKKLDKDTHLKLKRLRIKKRYLSNYNVLLKLINNDVINYKKIPKKMKNFIKKLKKSSVGKKKNLYKKIKYVNVRNFRILILLKINHKKKMVNLTKKIIKQLKFLLFKKYFNNLNWFNYKKKSKIILNKNLIYSNWENLNKSLKILTKQNINIFFINSLSFIKFKYKLKDNLKNFSFQQIFVEKKFLHLQKFEHKYIRRWRQIQFRTKDIINLSLIAIMFKNAYLLSSFISYFLTFLPKSKRQRQFLKYITKIIMNFKGERKEVVGLKIRLKGRIDKWKRSRTWISDTGSLILQSYKSYIDYGCTKGLVKKGVFSIRVWLQYKPLFVNELKKTIFKYYKYSKIKQKIKFNI